MKWSVFLPYLLVTAGVTYLIRMLPLTVFRREIKSRFIRSFLAYIPYAVLGAMTFPEVFFSTGDLRTAAVGVMVAVVLAWRGKSLLTVAKAEKAARAAKVMAEKVVMSQLTNLLMSLLSHNRPKILTHYEEAQASSSFKEQ